MKNKNGQIKESWINDYLDLYLCAKKIGDVEWQKEILQKLNHADELVSKEVDAVRQYNLWIKFDRINKQLQSIYEQLRKEIHQFEKEQLREKAWELKNERVEISKKIRSIKYSSALV